MNDLLTQTLDRACSAQDARIVVPPAHITFTGVDEWTDLDRMRHLSGLYPIEWGVLFHPRKDGLRYPGVIARRRICDVPGIRRAAHLCGDYAVNIMMGLKLRVTGPGPRLPMSMEPFERIQINHTSPDPEMIWDFSSSNARSTSCIAQSRTDDFPTSTKVEWLFDRSGGKGVAPRVWPRHPGRRVGYAGGIGPDNVLDVLRAIGSETDDYWIDMETGVRTSDDRFDLDRVERVCQLVYGCRG